MTTPLVFIAAYLFGIATGWFLWGAASPRRPAATSDSPTPAAKLTAAAAALEALAGELKAARALLERSDEDDQSVADELAGLDAAIKRANGRLKLVMRALEGSGDEG